MKLKKMIISNYRCFGKEPVTIDIDDLTGFIGHNSSGKTALLSALSKMFGEKASDRIIERSDFYIPPSKSPEDMEKNDFFIETYFSFPEIKNGENNISIPIFFKNFVINEPQGEPYLRIRLDASWEKSSNPEGIIESKVNYILSETDKFEETTIIPVPRRDLEHIKVIYIPAIRQPNEQLKNVSGTIMYRLLNSVKWSESTKEKIKNKSQEVENVFFEEKGIEILSDSLKEQWNTYHQDLRYSNAKINFNSTDLETILKKVEVTFSPTETTHDFKVDELGDGLRSLFYLSIVDTMLEIEEKIIKKIQDGKESEHFNLIPPVLTIVALEEPENHISPHLLGRVIDKLKTISKKGNSQTLLTSHSPAIIKRIDPESIRYFRICNYKECSQVKSLTLPNKEKEEKQFKYIKEAVVAYPELYFAKLVILGEGDSEEIIIKKMLELKDTSIDSAEISIVPLGGRHVNHFWRLLSDLKIPYITLLDLDRERFGGGWGRIKYALQQLIRNGHDKNKLLKTTKGILSDKTLEKMNNWDVNKIEAMEAWIKMLEEYDVYFSIPLDIDFAMLTKFKDKYVDILGDSEGPMIKGFGRIHTPKNIEGKEQEFEDTYKQRIGKDVKATLKEEGGDGSTYTDEEKELMIWYNYFFLNRGKPTTHRTLFIENDDLIFEDFPECLQNFIESVIEKTNINLQNGGGKNDSLDK